LTTVSDRILVLHLLHCSMLTVSRLYCNKYRIAFVWQTMGMHRSFRHFHAIRRCLGLRSMGMSTWADPTSAEMPVHNRTSVFFLFIVFLSSWI